ncbi:GatB/YqeY domain-containing protein [Chitinimonas viridis]|uniref:GatB/YqeY domain-containing protein n=2 Tax=Chitinimonas TaxID=240411 RepID=A0ABT8B1H3_9NEIS|nr:MULTISPECIES: GatB/YqeY domain-containing protein [Chitinimonas]MDN3576067.1 GatB/YqeY domain-containing protein [Chitinimonas viridis]GLR14355.1 aspartyl-tRNA amidotransferase subunit B [Chitinimonas prasina]
MSLKQRITDDMKTAMREKDTARLGTIRLLLAAMKQKEVDERIELSDDQIVAIIDKMQKQRRDSISQYENAKRQDLADIEKAEMVVLEGYMPQQADETEIAAILDAAIATHGATVAAMGKIMAEVKPKLAGRADMSKVSALIKARLA